MYKFLLLFVAVLRCILIAECYIPNGEFPNGVLPSERFPYRGLPGTGGRMNGNCQSFNQLQEKYARCFEQLPLNVQAIARNGAGGSSVEAVRNWVCRDSTSQMISAMRQQNIDFTEQDRRLMGCVYPGGLGSRLGPGFGPGLEPGLGSRLVPGLGSRLEPGLGSRLEPGLAFQDKKQEKQD